MSDQDKEIRKWILHILKRAFLDGASLKVIRDALHRMRLPQTLEETAVHIRYLEIKGYVNIEHVEVEGVGSRDIHYLTPTGLDLLDGNIEADPGVAK
jgi:hypothetical protein